MQTGAIDKFWVATDPTPDSTIDDVLFETDAGGFIRQVKGGLTEAAHPRLYADRASAEADALARLAVVRGLSAIAGGVIRGDVRDAAKLTLLDDAGEVLFETKIERLPR